MSDMNEEMQILFDKLYGLDGRWTVFAAKAGIK